MNQQLIQILLRLWLILVLTSFTACDNSKTVDTDTESEYSSDDLGEDKDTISNKDAPQVSDGKDVVNDKFSTTRKKDIRLTKHARCRMDCRSITTGDLKTVLQRGKIVPKKSSLNAKPPKYCFEALVNGRKIHVVFADYPQYIRVITVINKSIRKDSPECEKCK